MEANIKVSFFTVSKTTKELILEWENQQPVIVAEDLRMPQFEMQKITMNKCHETNHMGKLEQLLTWHRGEP